VTEASYEQFLQHLEAGEAQDVLRAALIVPGANAARVAYCSTLAEQCLELANWVGFDSIIGGGSVGSDGESRGGSGRFDDFRGLAVVCQMLAELVSGAVRLQEADLYYAGAGLVRQVIECEYLLAAFDEDFSTAGQWFRAAPSDIRKSFQPKQLRKRSGFDDMEYWHHSDMGGHPSPAGAFLLELERLVPRMSDDPKPTADQVTAHLWVDLATHIARAWDRMVVALQKYHSRFETAGRPRRIVDAANAAHQMWSEVDVLAHKEILGGLLTGIAQLDSEPTS